MIFDTPYRDIVLADRGERAHGGMPLYLVHELPGENPYIKEIIREDSIKLSASMIIFSLTYHLLSFRVKDGYLVLALESTGGRYLGRTCSVKTSGRMITNDRPWGSHVTNSDKVASERISIKVCGKISFFFVDFESAFLVRPSSSLTTLDGTFRGLLSGGLMSSVSAVAASTRWESPLISGLPVEGIVHSVNCCCQ